MRSMRQDSSEGYDISDSRHQTKSGVSLQIYLNKALQRIALYVMA